MVKSYMILIICMIEIYNRKIKVKFHLMYSRERVLAITVDDESRK